VDEHESLKTELGESRRRFLEQVAALRPELHRYCARMTGSVADGEDVVQETLARAYYLLPELQQWPQLRPWLFRIAHHRCIDHLRRYDVRMSEPIEAAQDAADPAPEPGEALAHDEAVRAAVSRFVELAPAQRSCVVLKDVLGHSLEEIAALLELSLPAVKAALHRGRERLRQRQAAPAAGALPPLPPSPAVARYAALFNARDWDGVRALLAEDVQLDLYSRARRYGRREVGEYFSNYQRIEGWHLRPAWLEGREVLAVVRAPGETQVAYFIELGFRGGRLASIRDYRYVPYVLQEALIQLVPAA
jgi:RNA polymerase sigma-70 factor (ECF subfamily)